MKMLPIRVVNSPRNSTAVSVSPSNESPPLGKIEQKVLQGFSAGHTKSRIHRETGLPPAVIELAAARLVEDGLLCAPTAPHQCGTPGCGLLEDGSKKLSCSGCPFG